MKDVKWATYTCPIGFEALGIWPEGADGTDINAIDRFIQDNKLIRKKSRFYLKKLKLLYFKLHNLIVLFLMLRYFLRTVFAF